MASEEEKMGRSEKSLEKVKGKGTRKGEKVTKDEKCIAARPRWNR